jgi:hypothetical protein
MRRLHRTDVDPSSSIPQSTMKTAAEYRKHAQECLVLANQMPSGEQQEQLMEMARTWEELARTREGLVRNHPELNTEKPSAKGQVPSKP